MSHPFISFLLPALRPQWLCALYCLFWLATPTISRQTSCCEPIKRQGQTEFDQKNYDKAIEIWSNGKKCTDAAECPDLANLIQKAQQAAAAKACDDAYAIANAADTKVAYETFHRQYPHCDQHAAAAQKRIKEIDELVPPTPPTTIPKPDMVLIRGGTFTMGCTSEQRDCGYDESPTFKATVSDFYLGRYEVTFEEYDAFCAATGRAKPNDWGWGRGKRPVIDVSWYDAVDYCNWLSEQHGLRKVYTLRRWDEVVADWSAKGYRLPTEAEWEYAARGGGKSVLFGNGKNIADPAEINFDPGGKFDYAVEGVYRHETVPVGSLNSPNGLGLHDMSGNVYEWCWDWYDDYSSGAKTNPRGPKKGSYRVNRGGCWYNIPRFCRVALRHNNTPSIRGYNVGFRLARS